MPAMGPRGDFSCVKCGVTHEDLPVESTRCPVTGFKRGFKRLYNAVNVSGAHQHAAAQIVDRVVAPEYNRQRAIQSEAIQSRAATTYAAPVAALTAARSGPNAAYAVPVIRGLRGQTPTWRPP